MNAPSVTNSSVIPGAVSESARSESEQNREGSLALDGSPKRVEAESEQEGSNAAGIKSASGNYVVFPPGETRIDGPNTAVLKRHATRLKENSKLTVTLVGYTESRGSRSYNLAIVEMRLNAVATLLRTFGVGRRQIRRIVKASGMAASKCKVPSCLNDVRHVELVYAH
ncbi:MAG: OmpA family protein [Rhodocyclaceae bacterium]|nr:OmpA family protein [Rhodocyclaceae bacterium]